MKFHLDELKFRLMYYFINLIISCTIIFNYKEILIHNLLNSTELKFLIYTQLTEAFFSWIYFSIFLSILISIPYLLYHIFYYFKSGLYLKEVYNLKLIIKKLLFIWIFGIFINKVFLIPYVIGFFKGFETDVFFKLTLNLKFIDFIDFYINCFLILNLSLITPFLIEFYLNFLKNKSFKFKFILNIRKYFYFCLILLIGLFTPPDLISELIIGGIIIIIIEILIFKLILEELLNS